MKFIFEIFMNPPTDAFSDCYWTQLRKTAWFINQKTNFIAEMFSRFIFCGLRNDISNSDFMSEY